MQLFSIYVCHTETITQIEPEDDSEGPSANGPQCGMWTQQCNLSVADSSIDISHELSGALSTTSITYSSGKRLRGGKCLVIFF